MIRKVHSMFHLSGGTARNRRLRAIPLRLPRTYHGRPEMRAVVAR